MNYANPFDEERIAEALEAKGRPLAAALTRGIKPYPPRERGDGNASSADK